jgi:hypothetical protein
MAIGEAMRNPDGSVAERLAQRKQGGDLKGLQGPLAVTVFDEVRPTWGKAGMDMVPQLTTPVCMELPESYQGHEQGRIRLTCKWETQERLEERSDVPRFLAELPSYRGARLRKSTCSDGIKTRSSRRRAPAGIV